jgi:hypothetical protein
MDPCRWLSLSVSAWKFNPAKPGKATPDATKGKSTPGRISRGLRKKVKITKLIHYAGLRSI